MADADATLSQLRGLLVTLADTAADPATCAGYDQVLLDVDRLTPRTVPAARPAPAQHRCATYQQAHDQLQTLTDLGVDAFECALCCCALDTVWQQDEERP